MPEIYEMIFNISELFRFLPKEDNEFTQQIEHYESQLERDMAQNRVRLFGDYGYESDFEKTYFG